MVKSLSGVELRTGVTQVIGDNRYGLREAYDPAVEEATKTYYREGDRLTVKEIKGFGSQVVRTIKK